MEGKGISKHKYRLYALRLVVLVPSLVLSYELIFLPGSIKTDVSSKSQALDRPVDEREKKKKYISEQLRGIYTANFRDM